MIALRGMLKEAIFATFIIVDLAHTVRDKRRRHKASKALHFCSTPAESRNTNMIDMGRKQISMGDILSQGRHSMSICSNAPFNCKLLQHKRQPADLRSHSLTDTGMMHGL